MDVVLKLRLPLNRRHNPVSARSKEHVELVLRRLVRDASSARRITVTTERNEHHNACEHHAP